MLKNKFIYALLICAVTAQLNAVTKTKAKVHEFFGFADTYLNEASQAVDKANEEIKAGIPNRSVTLENLKGIINGALLPNLKNIAKYLEAKEGARKVNPDDRSKIATITQEAQTKDQLLQIPAIVDNIFREIGYAGAVEHTKQLISSLQEIMQTNNELKKEITTISTPIETLEELSVVLFNQLEAAQNRFNAIGRVSKNKMKEIDAYNKGVVQNIAYIGPVKQNAAQKYIDALNNISIEAYQKNDFTKVIDVIEEIDKNIQLAKYSSVEPSLWQLITISLGNIHQIKQKLLDALANETSTVTTMQGITDSIIAQLTDIKDYMTRDQFYNVTKAVDKILKSIDFDKNNPTAFTPFAKR